MSETTSPEDKSGDRKYFVAVPQLVWLLARDPYDLALWTTIKMIAGEEGECYLSTPDLATAAMMSAGKVNDCRQYLLETGLIQGELRKDPGYPQPVWHLTIPPNLWTRNTAWRRNHNSLRARIALKRLQKEKLKRQKELSCGERGPTPGERGPAPGERGPTPSETKNNHKGKPQENPFTPASAGEDPRDVLDLLFESAQRGTEPSWTISPEAGGADAFADGPLTSFCDLVGSCPDRLSESERRNWPGKLREIAEAHRIDAAEMEECIKALPESDWAWRVPSFTSPYTSGFADVISALIRRRLAGNPVLTKSDGNHHRPSRRGERAGYEPCTDKERQDMWARYGGWARDFVSAEEERMRKAGCLVPHVNPHVLESAAMKQLGLTKRQAQALAEAHSIETAEPLDVIEFLGESG